MTCPYCGEPIVAGQQECPCFQDEPPYFEDDELIWIDPCELEIPPEE